MVVGRGQAIAFIGEVRRGNSDVEFLARGSEREREKCVVRILTLVRGFTASCWRREAMEWRIDGELESLASTVARCVSEQGTSAREGK